MSLGQISLESICDYIKHIGTRHSKAHKDYILRFRKTFKGLHAKTSKAHEKCCKTSHKTSKELSVEKSWRPSEKKTARSLRPTQHKRTPWAERLYIYTELRKANGNVYIYRDTHTAKTHKSLKPHVKLIRLVHTVYTHIRLIGFTKLI